MKTPFSILVLFLFFGISFAQENHTEVVPSLSEQFDNLYRKSTIYGNYKAMKIVDYISIKENVLDTVQTQQLILVEKTKLIEQNTITIGKLNKEVKYLESKLAEAQSKNDNRYFLGVKLQKSIYTIVLIVTYLLLIVLVVFFALKYQKNIAVTQQTVKNNKLLSKEFEEYKKTSLKRFQEVNRKLQDELNKKWKKEN